MILENVITKKEHGLFNRVFVSGFIHKFSGVNSLMERITAYSTENGLSFSEGALRIYQEKVEEEIREVPRRPMNINNQVQGDLIYLERFLIKRRLIKDPRFESHLKGESNNMYNYAKERGFDPDVLIEVLREEGHSIGQAIRCFVDVFSQGEGYMVEVYKSPEIHIKNLRLLNALEKYLLRTGKITEEDVKINKWIHDLRKFGEGLERLHTEKKLTSKLSRKSTVGYLLNRIKEFNDENPSENPVAEFYKALMRGDATLSTSRGQRIYSSEKILGKYIELKFPELKVN